MAHRSSILRTCMPNAQQWMAPHSITNRPRRQQQPLQSHRTINYQRSSKSTSTSTACGSKPKCKTEPHRNFTITTHFSIRSCRTNRFHHRDHRPSSWTNGSAVRPSTSSNSSNTNSNSTSISNRVEPINCNKVDSSVDQVEPFDRWSAHKKWPDQMARDQRNNSSVNIANGNSPKATIYKSTSAPTPTNGHSRASFAAKRSGARTICVTTNTSIRRISRINAPIVAKVSANHEPWPSTRHRIPTNRLNIGPISRHKWNVINHPLRQPIQIKYRYRWPHQF